METKSPRLPDDFFGPFPLQDDILKISPPEPIEKLVRVENRNKETTKETTKDKRLVTLPRGTVWEHYSRGECKIIALVQHSETFEEMVIYQVLEEQEETWLSPLSLFSKEVFINKKEGKPPYVAKTEK